MIGYRPSGPAVVEAISALIAAGAMLGLFLTRRPLPGAVARASAWAAGALLVAGAERLTTGEPGGFRMVAICSVLFVSMKAIVGVETLSRGGRVLPAGRWLGFALAWPGMEPSFFDRRRRIPADGAASLLAGAIRLAAGAVLIGAAALAAHRGLPIAAVTAFLIAGASLVVHFGLFTILAGVWRAAGVPVRPPFRAPLGSRRLAEFWGRRWNVPFTEMVRATIYPAVRSLAGPRAALMAGFLFSGFLHELAITIPVRAGYGGPLLYFTIQGGLVAVERRVLGEPGSFPQWRGRAWTLAGLLLPLPFLIPSEFLRQVVWPVIGISAAAAS